MPMQRHAISVNDPTNIKSESPEKKESNPGQLTLKYIVVILVRFLVPELNLIVTTLYPVPSYRS